MTIAFWNGDYQGLSIILGLILALILTFSPELTLAFILGLFLYFCLGLGLPKEASEITEYKELSKDKELNKMDGAFTAKVSVEPATKEKEKEELGQEDMRILITDVRALSQYEFDHFEEIYQDFGSNETSRQEEEESEEAVEDPDPARDCPSTSS